MQGRKYCNSAKHLKEKMRNTPEFRGQNVEFD